MAGGARVRQQAETYGRIYASDPGYAMRAWRRGAWAAYLRGLDPPAGSLLDVGCGRGESLSIARAEGVARVHGAEIVPALCGPDVTLLAGGAARLPFDADTFDLVTSMDVLEHLDTAGAECAARELLRVARCRVFVGVPHTADRMGLHLTVRDRTWWQALLRSTAPVRAKVVVVGLPVPPHKRP